MKHYFLIKDLKSNSYFQGLGYDEFSSNITDAYSFDSKEEAKERMKDATERGIGGFSNGMFISVVELINL